MTPLEKAARAAARSCFSTDYEGSDLDAIANSVWHELIEPVRAALLAIREPDEGTLIASGMLDPESWELARSMWKDMIDHVLESGS